MFLLTFNAFITKNICQNRMTSSLRKRKTFHGAGFGKYEE